MAYLATCKRADSGWSDGGLTKPIGQAKACDAFEVLQVARDQHEPSGDGDRGNLGVNLRQGAPRMLGFPSQFGVYTPVAAS
jgi:hypothetical protein